MFLLDTCICIDFLRGAMPNVLAMLRAHEPSDIAVPTVVEAELRLGALKSARPDENGALVELFLVPLERVEGLRIVNWAVVRICGIRETTTRLLIELAGAFVLRALGVRRRSCWLWFLLHGIISQRARGPLV
jgi:predicted nucleic acid-binding protein